MISVSVDESSCFRISSAIEEAELSDSDSCHHLRQRSSCSTIRSRLSLSSLPPSISLARHENIFSAPSITASSETKPAAGPGKSYSNPWFWRSNLRRCDLSSLRNLLSSFGLLICLRLSQSRFLLSGHGRKLGGTRAGVIIVPSAHILFITSIEHAGSNYVAGH